MQTFILVLLLLLDSVFARFHLWIFYDCFTHYSALFFFFFFFQIFERSFSINLLSVLFILFSFFLIYKPFLPYFCSSQSKHSTAMVFDKTRDWIHWINLCNGNPLLRKRKIKRRREFVALSSRSIFSFCLTYFTSSTFSSFLCFFYVFFPPLLFFRFHSFFYVLSLVLAFILIPFILSSFFFISYPLNSPFLFSLVWYFSIFPLSLHSFKKFFSSFPFLFVFFSPILCLILFPLLFLLVYLLLYLFTILHLFSFLVLALLLLLLLSSSSSSSSSSSVLLYF